MVNPRRSTRISQKRRENERSNTSSEPKPPEAPKAMPKRQSKSRVTKSNEGITIKGRAKAIKAAADRKKAVRVVAGPDLRDECTSTLVVEKPGTLESASQQQSKHQPGQQPEQQVIAQMHFKVERVASHPAWQSTLNSLGFTQYGDFPHDSDTCRIALNLIDYLLVDANWDPALSRNLLAAACYLFAHRLTGRVISAEAIANAVVEEGTVAKQFVKQWTQAMAETGKQAYADALADALTMSVERLEAGYGLLWGRRREFERLVGDFVENIEGMIAPAASINEAAVEIKGIEKPEVEMVVELDLDIDEGFASAEATINECKETGNNAHKEAAEEKPWDQDLEFDELDAFVAENE